MHSLAEPLLAAEQHDTPERLRWTALYVPMCPETPDTCKHMCSPWVVQSASWPGQSAQYQEQPPLPQCSAQRGDYLPRGRSGSLLQIWTGHSSQKMTLPRHLQLVSAESTAHHGADVTYGRNWWKTWPLWLTLWMSWSPISCHLVFGSL